MRTEQEFFDMLAQTKREWSLADEICRKRPYHALYRNLCYKAEQAGREVLLSYEEFIEFTKVPLCHYCDAPVTWTKHVSRIGETQAYNLDRVDNGKDYFKENLVVCCGRCNKAKGKYFTYSEWIEIGKVIKTFKDKNDSGIPMCVG